MQCSTFLRMTDIRYSDTITLQIEKYSFSFAHVGPDAP